MNRTFGEMLSAEITQIQPLEFIITTVRNPETGKLQIKDSDEALWTPEETAFNFLEQQGLLVRPDHKQTIKMCFYDETHPRNYDDPIDTIYIKTSKPLEYIVGTDGSTQTFCDRWKAECLPEGNLHMCHKIPVHNEGRCRITMEFSDMERIL
jgi:hypothetical protein